MWWRGRAFNLVQGTPARLRDLAMLFAILREISSRPVTEALAPVYQRPISGSSDISCWTAGGVVAFAAVGHGRQDAPISEIAYVCGFRDYTHFARKFRQRFGYSPGAATRNMLALPTQ